MWDGERRDRADRGPGERGCPGGVMNANVLKSKSLFCLDASYAPLHTVGGGACARKRIKGWDKGTVIFSRLYFCPLSPHHPFARPVVPAVFSPSLFFVKFVPAALTVASARYRETALALFARKVSSLLDAGCIFYVTWFSWISLIFF